MLGIHAANANTNNLRGLGDFLRDAHERSGRKIGGITTLDLRLVTELQHVEYWGFRTQKAIYPGGDGDNPPPDVVYAAPKPTARQWIDMLVPIWRMNLNPSPSFLLIANEQDPADPAHAALYDEYTLEAMRYYDATYRAELGGVPLGIYGFSAGCPTQGPHGNDWPISAMWAALLPSTRYAVEHGHWICLHNHAGDAGSLIASGENKALRHRHAIRYWQAQGIDTTRALLDLSETSNGVGGVEPDLSTYLANIQWLLEQLIAERTATWPGVKFISCYQFGGAGERLQDAIPGLTQLHIDHPLPPIDPIDPPPPVDRQYERVVHLLPPSVKIEQDLAHFDPRFLQVAHLAASGRESIVASADDAFINPPQCTKRTVYVYNVGEWGGRDYLEAWVEEWYAPLPTIIYRELAA
jgi:hypothetical protein